jgi:hypothetical protein
MGTVQYKGLALHAAGWWQRGEDDEDFADGADGERAPPLAAEFAEVGAQAHAGEGPRRFAVGSALAFSGMLN